MENTESERMQAVYCNHCGKELGVPKDVFQMAYDAKLRKLRQRENRGSEMFLPFAGQHPGYYLSEVSGAFYCNENCLLLYSED